MTTEVFIVGAARTPIGSLGGSLSTLKASDLGAVAIKESIQRANLSTNDVDLTVMGQTLQAGEGQNPARQAAVKAGIPYSRPAYTVNQLCGSGLQAIVLGCQSIRVGESTIVVCGGQESMSSAPHCVNMRVPKRMGNGTLLDTMIHDGLTDAFQNVHMGITAENIASEKNVSRVDQDKFAAESQHRVERAQKAGLFDDEIVPVETKTRKGTQLVTTDEFPCHGTDVAELARLRPAFKTNDGTVTAGNASGVNDGAAAVVLVSGGEVEERGLTPLARIVGSVQVGLNPDVMGLGPIEAVRILKIGWSKEDVDLYELNEAFASQSLAVLRELNLDPGKVNINGGAIALGHPIGASGARILVTLLYALKRTGGKKGIASLCIGGGMGIALAVQID